MKKYWHVVNIGIQNNLAYRVNFLFRIVFGFIPLLATIYLWRAIYRGKSSGEEVSAYSLAQMTSYYLLVTIVDALTAVNEDDWQIAADIKDGNISQFLLKPIDYLAYRLCLYSASRLIYLAVAAIPLGLSPVRQLWLAASTPQRHEQDDYLWTRAHRATLPDCPLCVTPPTA